MGNSQSTTENTQSGSILKTLIANNVPEHVVGFLDAHDLELVALVCNDFHRLATNDNVWRALCDALWEDRRNADHLRDPNDCVLAARPNRPPERFVSGVGHRQLYWQLNCQTMDWYYSCFARRGPFPPPPLPPTRPCQEEDIQLIVNIFYNNGHHHEIYIEGEALAEFLRDTTYGGMYSFPINPPVEPVEDGDGMHLDFKITVDMIRYTDMAYFCILERIPNENRGSRWNNLGHLFEFRSRHDENFWFAESDRGKDLSIRLQNKNCGFQVEIWRNDDELEQLDRCTILATESLDEYGVTMLDILSELAPPLNRRLPFLQARGHLGQGHQDTIQARLRGADGGPVVDLERPVDSGSSDDSESSVVRPGGDDVEFVVPSQLDGFDEAVLMAIMDNMTNQERAAIAAINAANNAPAVAADAEAGVAHMGERLANLDVNGQERSAAEERRLAWPGMTEAQRRHWMDLNDGDGAGREYIRGFLA